MSLRPLIPFAVVALLGIPIIGVELVHRYNYGHFVSYGLHVDALSMDESIGIPGQTKLYWAELSNFSFRPVEVAACNYVTDTMSPGTDLPYAVQRWNATEQIWQTVIDSGGPGFCRPIPLGRGNTRIVSKRLWPAASVRVMDWEATGAREPFRHGDLARFVVFRNVTADMELRGGVASPPFVIEDAVSHDDVNYRVKH